VTIPLSRPLRTGLFYALRTAFRLVPMPVATRDRLRQRFLDRHADLVPPPPRGQAATGTGIHRPLVRSDERAIGYVPYRQDTLPDPLPATLVAFYLPQFHTIPENDEWWGKGFTEWRNVARALPQFEGHHQPRLPGDLGFYDLRNPEVMREQARLAREYGISAFCFYFYWFGGKTLLETPLRNWLDDKTIDLQFCLCWANEKWSRTWDGRGDEILIDQQHSPEDDIAFIAHVAEYMRDPRYLRVDGKPMLLVYRPGLFPDMKATAGRWRHWCAENGIGDIHLAYVQSFERPEAHGMGFDSAVEFPPNLGKSLSISRDQALLNEAYAGDVLDWRSMANSFQQPRKRNYWIHPGVNPAWDNESRRPGRGRTFLHSSHRLYASWLRHAVDLAHEQAPTSPLVFINAWNEWAEGATLEPDMLWGFANLEATRRVLKPGPTRGAKDSNVHHVIIHAWYLDVLEEILQKLKACDLTWKLVITSPEQLMISVSRLISDYGFEAELIPVENRGRDILPFLSLANRLLDDGIDVVLKLHTKRSPHRGDGAHWLHELLERLLGGDRPAQITKAFDAHPELGLVGAEGHILPVGDYMGANAETVSRLQKAMGLFPSSDPLFVSGSMFWVRLQSLRPLLDVPLKQSEFENEAGQVDGTLSHAVERIFGTCVQANGFQVTSAAAVCGVPEVTPKNYRFAHRSAPQSFSE